MIEKLTDEQDRFLKHAFDRKQMDEQCERETSGRAAWEKRQMEWRKVMDE